MQTFFHGWRRKAGCALLLLAVALTVGWVRSFITVDFFEIRSANCDYRVNSMGGTLKFVRATQLRTPSEYHFWETRDFSMYKDHYQEYWRAYSVLWRWDFVGLHFGAGIAYPDTDHELTVEVYAFPDSLMIFILTILSAYLILWKSRQRKSSSHSPVDA